MEGRCVSLLKLRERLLSKHMEAGLVRVQPDYSEFTAEQLVNKLTEIHEAQFLDSKCRLIATSPVPCTWGNRPTR